MPVVDLLARDHAPLTTRTFFRSDGSAGPLTASLAHVPEILQTLMPFIGAALGPSSIDVRTKEIVILRTSAIMQCRYCVQTHTVVASKVGFSREDLEALRGPVPAMLPDSREQLLLAWTEAVALGRGPIAAELTERFTAMFSDAELVELTALVGATMLLNRYATALELPTSAEHLAFLTEEGWI